MDPGTDYTNADYGKAMFRWQKKKNEATDRMKTEESEAGLGKRGFGTALEKRSCGFVK